MPNTPDLLKDARALLNQAEGEAFIVITRGGYAYGGSPAEVSWIMEVAKFHILQKVQQLAANLKEVENARYKN